MKPVKSTKQQNLTQCVSHYVSNGILYLFLVLACATARADLVEITLADDLDGILNGYCLDIAKGQKENANPDNGLQAHTCYSHEGQLAIDQIFDTDKFADEQLYMPEFDVCAMVSGVEAGASVALASCDGSDAQRFTLTDNGQITAAADPSLCITAAEETSTGRSKTNLMRALTLQACSDANALLQVWRIRTEDD